MQRSTRSPAIPDLQSDHIADTTDLIIQQCTCTYINYFSVLDAPVFGRLMMKDSVCSLTVRIDDSSVVVLFASAPPHVISPPKK